MTARNMTLSTALLLALTHGNAVALTAVLKVGDCRPGQVVVEVESDGIVNSFGVPIPAPMSATEARDQIVAWLLANSPLLAAPIELDRISLRDLPPATHVRLRPIGVATALSVRTVVTSIGGIGFAGHFVPSDSFGQPAIFTAGIVTDVGELTAQVSAAELNFQTDGPIICQALFQRLAPRAPQYGAQINYAGDRLEVYFDPAYTLSPGGVTTGTTSQSPGAMTGVLLPILAESPRGRLRVGFAPCAAGPEELRLGQPGQQEIYNIMLPGALSGQGKRDAIMNWFIALPPPLTTQPAGLATIVMDDKPPGTSLSASPAGNASTDRVTVTGCRDADVRFPGVFSPFDRNHQPAVFTAGIITDVGELTATISAAELNFQTDGPIICQALFQRLAPRAPQYGAQIHYAGDRLEVYFDPAYTAVAGGSVAGSTSQTPVGAATVTVPSPGDINGDGVLNGLDLQAFIDALVDPLSFFLKHPNGQLGNADMNGDGVITWVDARLLLYALLAQPQ